MTDSELDGLRARTRALCAQFPDEYWRETDRNRALPAGVRRHPHRRRAARRTHPHRVRRPRARADPGLGDHGGDQQVGRALRRLPRPDVHHGCAAAARQRPQKNAYLPLIAKGELRLQAFSITEPAAGSDTTSITTAAERDGDDYVITGHKNWTSRIGESDLALVLARTSDKAEDRTRGLTLFLVDLRQVRAEQPGTLRGRPGAHDVQLRHQPGALPRHARAGRPRRSARSTPGFRYVIDGWNAERILLASEAIGDGYWFVERAVDYANEREVFGRPIGANQGVQFPLADAYMKVRAADMMRYEAARLFDEGKPCGAEANMAKHLASEASWAAANAALDTHGGNGFVDQYDIERKFRETRMFQVAPVNNNLIKAFVATKVLGLPRSY